MHLHHDLMLACARSARAASDAPRPPGLPRGASVRMGDPSRGRRVLDRLARRRRERAAREMPLGSRVGLRGIPVSPAARDRARRERRRELYFELEFAVEFPLEEELRR